MTFLYPSGPLLLFSYVTIDLCNYTQIVQQNQLLVTGITIGHGTLQADRWMHTVGGESL